MRTPALALLMLPMLPSEAVLSGDSLRAGRQRRSSDRTQAQLPLARMAANWSDPESAKMDLAVRHARKVVQPKIDPNITDHDWYERHFMSDAHNELERLTMSARETLPTDEQLAAEKAKEEQAMDRIRRRVAVENAETESFLSNFTNDRSNDLDDWTTRNPGTAAQAGSAKQPQRSPAGEEAATAPRTAPAPLPPPQTPAAKPRLAERPLPRGDAGAKAPEPQPAMAPPPQAPAANVGPTERPLPRGDAGAEAGLDPQPAMTPPPQAPVANDGPAERPLPRGDAGAEAAAKPQPAMAPPPETPSAKAGPAERPLQSGDAGTEPQPALAPPPQEPTAKAGPTELPLSRGSAGAEAGAAPRPAQPAPVAEVHSPSAPAFPYVKPHEDDSPVYAPVLPDDEPPKVDSPKRAPPHPVVETPTDDHPKPAAQEDAGKTTATSNDGISGAAQKKGAGNTTDDWSVVFSRKARTTPAPRPWAPRPWNWQARPKGGHGKHSK